MESKSDQVVNEQANLVTFVKDIERWLLAKRNLPQAKLHDQRIFVGLLNEPVPQAVENLDRTANNLKHLILQ